MCLHLFFAMPAIVCLCLCYVFLNFICVDWAQFKVYKWRWRYLVSIVQPKQQFLGTGEFLHLICFYKQNKRQICQSENNFGQR